MNMFVKQQLMAGLCITAMLIAFTSSAQTDIPYKSEDRSKIKTDLAYLLGYQLLATGIIYYSPEEFSNWSEEEKDALGIEQWKENIQNPVWDKDHWVVNYVLHPYWGAAYYIRGRERGFSKTGSFWVAVLFSTVYEFGFESFLEEPSIQDLIVTPVAGAALGMYFEIVRNRIRKKQAPLSRSDRVVLGLTDPLGALNRKVGSWFGADSQQQPKALLGLSLLHGSSGVTGQVQPQIGKVQKIDGVAITFRYRF
jgi:hypothetical protein